MAEWSSEASEYLDGYLKQVSVLVSEQGDDPTDVISELRDHVANEVELDGARTVTIDRLMHVLSELGTPEEIANLDPLSIGSTSTSRRASGGNRDFSSRGLWACCLAVAIVPLLGLVVVVLLMLASFGTIKREVVTGEDLTLDQYERVIDEQGKSRWVKIEADGVDP